MKFFLICLLFFIDNNVKAQFQPTKEYVVFIHKADSLYSAKEYLKSSEMFSNAFQVNDDLGSVKNRYNAACSWALSKKNDSAFYQLYRIVAKGNFKDYANLTNDSDLSSLHSDARWEPLLKLVLENQMKIDNY